MISNMKSQRLNLQLQQVNFYNLIDLSLNPQSALIFLKCFSDDYPTTTGIHEPSSVCKSKEYYMFNVRDHPKMT